MAFFSGLRRPAGGVEAFLAALRDRIERDRLRAGQAAPAAPADPADAARIAARSRAIDARRAEAKAQAKRARISGRMVEGAKAPGSEILGRGRQDAVPVAADAAMPILAGQPLPSFGHGPANSRDRSESFSALAAYRRPEPDLGEQARRIGSTIPGEMADPEAAPIVGPASGQADLGRRHGAQERAGNRAGSALGAQIRAEFKPSATPADPEEERRVLAGKLDQIGGLNGVGYIPRPEDYDTLSRIIYAESFDHPGDDAAIGWATINRVGRDGFQPTLDEVLHADNQFAIVSEGNPEGVDTPLWIQSAQPERLPRDRRERWLRAQKTAHGILNGQLPDPTGGATRFFASRNYHLGERPPGDFEEALADDIIRPSKFETTARSGRRQYFFHETAPRRPLSRQ